MSSVQALYDAQQQLHEAMSRPSSPKGFTSPELLAAYDVILNGAKGDSAAKRLTASFIVSFFKSFAAQRQQQALDALMDLCEDDEVLVRIATEKELPRMCRENLGYTVKIADVLSQLLPSDEDLEVTQVKRSLLELVRLDVRACTAAMMQQIGHGSDDVKQKTLNFLLSDVAKILPELLKAKPELAIAVGEAIETSFTTLDADAIQKMVKLLLSFEVYRTKSERKEILTQSLAMASAAAKDAQKGASCRRFLELLLSTPAEQVIVLDSRLQQRLVKAIADCCRYESASSFLPTISTHFRTILTFLVDEDAQNEIPRGTYVQLEALLYGLHAVSIKAPTPDSMDDLNSRIKHIYASAQLYTSHLRTTLEQLNQAVPIDQEQVKIHQVSLKVATSLFNLAKELLKPPHLRGKTLLSPSWDTSASMASLSAPPSRTNSDSAINVPKSPEDKKRKSLGQDSRPNGNKKAAKETPKGGAKQQQQQQKKGKRRFNRK